jgi:hypothetical protein
MLTAIYARKSTEQNAPEEARSVTLQLDRARVCRPARVARRRRARLHRRRRERR